ncbi:hypothetical protein ACG2F4_18540 [Halalkalibaculum sp. DA3122]|uniref:hypothetical protein n=1 Tax=unclassified Halalkalibaculum TaxID=2964617 RepID=UPI003755288C
MLAGCSTTGSLTYQERALTKADLQTVNIDQVTGHWEGIYHVYPNLMGIELDLLASDTTNLSGELHFYPLDEKRGPGRLSPGSYSVIGSYDPVTRTLELKPKTWINKPRGRVTALPLSGVVDTEGPAIAGFLGQQRTLRDRPIYFALMRTDKAESRLKEPFRRSSEQVNLQASGVGSIFNKLGRDIPGDEEILQWAGRFSDEYPEINPDHTEMGTLYNKVVNLFEDEHFIAHFGLPFEQMSPGQRDMVADRLTGSYRSFGDRSDYMLRDYRAFSRAFNSSGSPGTPGITAALLAQRVIRSWQRTTQYRLSHLSPKPGTFAKIANIEERSSLLLHTLWPSEQREFNDHIADIRQKLATPILAASAEKAVTNSSGYDGARRLALWEQNNQELLQYVDISEKESLISKVEHRRDELLSPLMDVEIGSLQQIPNTASAVDKGNEWYTDFNNRYGFASQSQPYQQVLSVLQARREEDLSRVLASYGEQINKLTPEENVDDFISSVLVVPGDQYTPPGKTLVRMADTRKQTIEARRKLQSEIMFVLVATLLLQSDTGNDQYSQKATDEGPNCVVQGIGRVARDKLIYFSLSAFWPTMDETTVSRLQQYISGFLDNDLTPGSIGKILIQQQVVEMLGNDNPAVQDFTLLVELTSSLIESCDG